MAKSYAFFSADDDDSHWKPIGYCELDLYLDGNGKCVKIGEKDLGCSAMSFADGYGLELVRPKEIGPYHHRHEFRIVAKFSRTGGPCFRTLNEPGIELEATFSVLAPICQENDCKVFLREPNSLHVGVDSEALDEYLKGAAWANVITVALPCMFLPSDVVFIDGQYAEVTRVYLLTDGRYLDRLKDLYRGLITEHGRWNVRFLPGQISEKEYFEWLDCGFAVNQRLVEDMKLLKG